MGEPDAGGRELPEAPGGSEFRALSLDVLRIEDGQLVEITTFEPHLFVHFGLPRVWTG